MKAVYIFLIVLSTFGCSDLVNLNDKIYEAQKQAVLISPYKSASGTLGYIDAEKDFRLNTELPQVNTTVNYFKKEFSLI